MWFFKLYPYILVPSAAGAGFFTWILTRGRKPDDGELMKNFLVALAMLMMIAAGLSRTEFARSRWDEAYKAQVAYLAMPVHVALRDHRPDEWKQVEQITLKAFDELPPQAVIGQTRAQYLPLARRMMENAQGTAIIAYAEALVPVLEHLQKTEPRLCVRMAWAHVPSEPFDVAPKLPGPVNDGYERAVARLIAENSTSAVNASKWKPQESATLEELRTALIEMGEPFRARHGIAPEELFTPAVAQFDPAAACAASADLFKRALALEPVVARTLLTRMLRPS